MNDTVNTHDLLRPTATRANGTRAWVWYAAIAGVALVIIVYLTGIFMNKPPEISQAAGSTVGAPPIMQAANQFRYTGHVVNHTDQQPIHRQGAPGQQGSTSGPNPPLPTIAPATQNAQTPQYGKAAYPTSVVPDVSGSYIEKIHLPTPAPNDGFPGQGVGIQPAKRGIQVVYGAPETSDAPVSASTAINTAQTTAAAAPIAVAAQTAQATNAAGGLAGQSSETMPGRRRPPTARYMVTAGTKIYASLEGYVQSDMPGPVTAKVTSPVIDSLTGEVLVPAGSQVLGYYAGLTQNASALNIGWTRLKFPDESSIALDKLPALNEDGHMGVAGSYDDHRGKLFRATFIGAILSGVAQRFLGSGSTTTNIYVSTGSGTQQQPYAASAQMILDLVNRLNSKNDQIPPTIVLPANTPLEIYADRDMIFEGPYRPMKAAQ
jgi:type IV secretory pathway VirB10-like protein